MKHKTNTLSLLITLIILLSGCSNSGRYTMKTDKAPLRPPNSLELQGPTPRYLPIYPPSLRPYTVLGKRYTPMKTAKNYTAQGTASWYGRKFHGHQTSNGEIYNMFGMSAAHKTLPIPSFVRVTNVDNNKSIIVKVNDRGPFHDNRLIDLSYAAAYALDMLALGTATVKVEAIVVDMAVEMAVEKDQPYQQFWPAPDAAIPVAKVQAEVKVEAPVTAIFIQVFASSDVGKITQTARRIRQTSEQPTQILSANGIYKLRVGPLQSKEQAQTLIKTLKNNGYPDAYMLYSQPALTHN